MPIIMQIINKLKQLFLVITAFFLLIFIGEDIRKKDNGDMLDKES